MSERKEIRIERTNVANGLKAWDVGVATYRDKLLDHYEVTGRYPTLGSARAASRQVWDKEGHHVAIIEIPDVSTLRGEFDENCVKAPDATIKDMLDALTKQLNNGDLSQLNAENAKKFADLMRMAKEEEKAREALQRKPSNSLTATCLNNLGMEDRFDNGASYPMERLADAEMLLVTDKAGVKVEVMRERFRFDAPKLVENLATDEMVERELAQEGYDVKAFRTNFEVQIEAKIKELDEKIEKLLVVVGKYDKLKNPDKVKEYRDALADLDPLMNERDKLEADERRFKAGHFLADGTTSNPRCDSCAKWAKDSGSDTVGVCTSRYGQHSCRVVTGMGSCDNYQPLLPTENKDGYP